MLIIQSIACSGKGTSQKTMLFLIVPTNYSLRSEHRKQHYYKTKAT